MEFSRPRAIQITGKNLYQLFADDTNSDLNTITSYMTTPNGIIESACWYWTRVVQLNKYVNRTDVPTVTKIINGGPLVSKLGIMNLTVLTTPLTRITDVPAPIQKSDTLLGAVEQRIDDRIDSLTLLLQKEIAAIREIYELKLDNLDTKLDDIQKSFYTKKQDDFNMAKEHRANKFTLYLTIAGWTITTLLWLFNSTPLNISIHENTPIYNPPHISAPQTTNQLNQQ